MWLQLLHFMVWGRVDFLRRTVYNSMLGRNTISMNSKDNSSICNISQSMGRLKRECLRWKAIFWRFSPLRKGACIAAFLMRNFWRGLRWEMPRVMNSNPQSRKRWSDLRRNISKMCQIWKPFSNRWMLKKSFA